jgi:hypothetical protein
VLFAQFLPGEAEDDRLSGEELLELLEGDLPSVQSDNVRLLDDLSLEGDANHASKAVSEQASNQASSVSQNAECKDNDRCLKNLYSSWWDYTCSDIKKWDYYCVDYHNSAWNSGQVRKCCPKACESKFRTCPATVTGSGINLPEGRTEKDLGKDCEDDDECLHENTNWGRGYTCHWSANTTGGYTAAASYCNKYPKPMRACCKKSCPEGLFQEADVNQGNATVIIENGFAMPVADNLIYPMEFSPPFTSGILTITKVDDNGADFDVHFKSQEGTTYVAKNPRKKCLAPFSWVSDQPVSDHVWRPLKAADATQSSDWLSWYGKRAIDGKRGTCSMTKPATGGWLRIDLGDYYEIQSVKISDKALQEQLTRLKKNTGAAAEKDDVLGIDLNTHVEMLSGTQVSVQDSAQNYAEVGKCGPKEGLASGESTTMREVFCLPESGLSGSPGRPVGNTIFLKRDDRLGLCEVEVIARPAKTVLGAECELAFSSDDESKTVEFKDGMVKVQDIFRTVKYVNSDGVADGTYTIKSVTKAQPVNENNLHTSVKTLSETNTDDQSPMVTLADANATSFINPAGNTKVAGAWVFIKSSSVQSEFTYTVGVTTSEGSTTSKAWSKSVENSATHGVSVEVSQCISYGTSGEAAGACGEELIEGSSRRLLQTGGSGGTTTFSAGYSGEWTSTTASSQESSKEISETLEQSKERSMSYSLPPGAMWQWEYAVSDSCTTVRRTAPVIIKVDHVAVTDTAESRPCCLPGFFADPTKPHGACINVTSADGGTQESPCLKGCSRETCYPAATSGGPCDEIIKGLKDLGLTDTDQAWVDRTMLKVIAKCPGMTGEELSKKLGITIT